MVAETATRLEGDPLRNSLTKGTFGQAKGALHWDLQDGSGLSSRSIRQSKPLQGCDTKICQSSTCTVCPSTQDRIWARTNGSRRNRHAHTVEWMGHAHRPRGQTKWHRPNLWRLQSHGQSAVKSWPIPSTPHRWHLRKLSRWKEIQQDWSTISLYADEDDVQLKADADTQHASRTVQAQPSRFRNRFSTSHLAASHRPSSQWTDQDKVYPGWYNRHWRGWRGTFPKPGSSLQATSNCRSSGQQQEVPILRGQNRVLWTWGQQGRTPEAQDQDSSNRRRS